MHRWCGVLITIKQNAHLSRVCNFGTDFNRNINKQRQLYCTKKLFIVVTTEKANYK